MTKILSRTAIQRMVGVAGGSSASAGGGTGAGGGAGADLTGYATEAWVNENYLSIEFFSSLFKAYDSAATPNEITPNDGDTTAITNIKAMFGFWTEQYLSARGLNSAGGGGGATTLADLLDVDITSPTNGQALVYNATSGKWENQTIGGGSTGTLSSVGLVMPEGFSVSPGTLTADGSFTVGFSSGYALPLVSDVNKGVAAYGWGNHANAGYLTSVSFSQILNTPTTLAGYGINDAYISNGSIVLGTNTITPWTTNNHPSTLAGYGISDAEFGTATTYYVPITLGSITQNVLLSNALAGYATKSWVGNNYLPLTGGTLTGDLRLKNISNYGMHLYFGDGSYCYLHEDTDDHLVIHAAKGVKFDIGSSYNVTIGSDIIATQPWVVEQGYLTSVTFSDLTNHPTTLSGYGITDSMLIKTLSSTSNIDTLYVAGSYRFDATAQGTWPTGVTANYGQMLVICGGGDTVSQMFFPYGDTRAYLRVGNPMNANNGSWRSWKELATTDGNVASATKLQTARSLWGNSFNGTEDINGSITMNNLQGIYIKDTGGTPINCVTLNTANTFALGYGARINNYSTDIQGSVIIFATNNGQTGGEHKIEALRIRGGGLLELHYGAMFNNNNVIGFKDSGGTEKSVLRLNNNNQFELGYGSAGSDYLTQIFGGATAGIKFYCGQSNEIASVYRAVDSNQNVRQGIRIGDGLLTWNSTWGGFEIMKYDGTAAHIVATGGVSALGFAPIINSLSAFTIINLTTSTVTSTNWNITSEGNAKFKKMYLDDTRYLFIDNTDGNKLKFYDGSQNKTVYVY